MPDSRSPSRAALPDKSRELFCDVALPVPLDRLFTYRVPSGISSTPSAGVRVIVPFGNRKLVGVVVRCGGAPSDLKQEEIKNIQNVIDEEPLVSDELLHLAQWIAGYYVAPIGEALSAMLPRQTSLHRKTRVVLTDEGRNALARDTEQSTDGKLLQRIEKRHGLRRESLRNAAAQVERLRRKGWVAFERSMDAGETLLTPPAAEASSGSVELALQAQRHELTRWQKTALSRIEDQLEERKFGVFLLHGVTGSGKTEVYMRAIERARAMQRSSLMLVPEISLTPAVAGLFVNRFGSRVAVMHSGLTDAEREEQWHRVKQGGADVVIGTRSAVFAPLERPGLVIVDEEHDSSYKQEETPRYHGRDVAIVRAKEAGAAVILGSATPAIESRHHADAGKYELLELEQRVEERPLPQTEVIDMREEFAATGRQSFLSRRLIEEISRRLQQHEQILILLNRRGYSAFVLCRSCGKTVECRNCSIALTHHRRAAQLLCHYCGFTQPVPKVCPHCSSDHIFFVGEGSEKVEDMLHQHFPLARIGRLDRDAARGRGTAEAILAAFQQHELDILVGTQMIAKGHDIHNVTLVGVISADIGLALPDFRSAERTFQLITQVSGRAGRGELPGEVIIQTFYPEHYAIRAAAAQDYSQFYKQELRFRELMHYPPFSSLANLIIRSTSQETAMKLTGQLGRHLETLERPGLKLLGPAAAPIHRLKQVYRFHFLIKAARRSVLRELLLSSREFAAREKFPAASLVIDVDPQSLF